MKYEWIDDYLLILPGVGPLLLLKDTLEVVYERK